MRRVTVKYARRGMILGAPVYDNFGTMLIDGFIRLDDDCIKILNDNSVKEIMLDDWRVADVPVTPVFPPELEGKLANTLRRLIVENGGKKKVDSSNIEQVSVAINAMVSELILGSTGEINVSGCASQEDYNYIQPVKTTTLSLIMGHRLGYSKADLANLGLAAILKDIGYITIPPELLHKPDLMSEKELLKIRQHPMIGYEILSQHNNTSGEVANAVLQHHERWDGSGYPYGLKGEDISRFSQIIAITDTFTALLSDRPGRRTYMPHETVEYVMAYSGEHFSPDLIELFVRNVPCYASGLTIELNTGEMGIISSPNLGFIGRPVVRICYDHEVGTVRKYYDINLARAEHQRKLITKIVDYY